ncbi:MAG: two-component system, OmpR family, phosphate regulon sensor histidine kinase PhoR [Acidimicrobiaceae bacterium]|nr:two-component system, OmpR family, phosphate regulon sensor histidine kinase PhoR [Acidimicrobiaceae bacterium]
MAADLVHDRLQAILRGLACGAEPTRLVQDALIGAVTASKAKEGLVSRVVNGALQTVASTGGAGQYLAEAAQDAVRTERMVRRRDARTGLVAAAEPIKAGSRVLGALVVGGGMEMVDAGPLSLFADAAALVLLRQPVAPIGALPEVLDTLSLVASSMDTASTMGHIFDAAARLFGAASGFCALSENGTMRIAAYRGVAQDRLVAASRRPEFKALLAPGEMRVDPPSDPAVAALTRLGEFAVGLPLSADGRSMGRLVVFLAEPPDPGRAQLLASFARNVALSLRAASLCRRIEDHEEQLASMVHAMANPVVVVDETGRVSEVNGAAAELFRLSTAFEIGHPVTGKLGHAGLERMLGPSGVDSASEVVLPGPNDGEPRVYRATARRMRAADGRALGRVLVLDDLTVERQADAIKADFVAVIGHELRTPLTVMKGYMHTLAKRFDTLSEEKRGQAIGAVQANLVRLERLIEDLLFISSVEQRRCKIDLESHDVAALLAERGDTRVTVRTPARPVEMLVDQPKFQQVVHHLLDNALKYSEGPVIVELADKGDEIEVSVTDSGPGIYSGDVPQLFERFRQLDGTSTRKHGGVGIGLYLCRRVVEALGGRIWCDSRLGVGSRFAFTLPKDGHSAEAATAAINRAPVST